MKRFRELTAGYLFGSLLVVSVAVWGCAGGGDGGSAANGDDHGGETSEPAGDDDAGGEVSVAAGKEVYLARCAMCHGESGKGDGPAGQALDPKPRDHTDRKYMDTLSNEEIENVVMNGKGAMPPHKAILTESEVESVVLYVRSLSS